MEEAFITLCVHIPVIDLYRAFLRSENKKLFLLAMETRIAEYPDDETSIGVHCIDMGGWAFDWFISRPKNDEVVCPLITTRNPLQCNLKLLTRMHTWEMQDIHATFFALNDIMVYLKTTKVGLSQTAKKILIERFDKADTTSLCDLLTLQDCSGGQLPSVSERSARYVKCQYPTYDIDAPTRIDECFKYLPSAQQQQIRMFLLIANRYHVSRDMRRYILNIILHEYFISK